MTALLIEIWILITLKQQQYNNNDDDDSRSQAGLHHPWEAATSSAWDLRKLKYYKYLRIVLNNVLRYTEQEERLPTWTVDWSRSSSLFVFDKSWSINQSRLTGFVLVLQLWRTDAGPLLCCPVRIQDHGPWGQTWLLDFDRICLWCRCSVQTCKWIIQL